MTFSYTLTEDEYLRYIVHLSDIHAGKKKKSTTAAFVQIAIAPVFFFLASSGILDMWGYVLGAFLLMVGAYSLAFFKLFFPRALRKTAVKTYRKRKYNELAITLTIDAEGIVNAIEDKEERFEWREILRIEEVNDAFYLMLGENRGAIVPKRASPMDPDALGQMMREAKEAQLQADKARWAGEQAEEEIPLAQTPDSGAAESAPPALKDDETLAQ
jgi:hypothetical protein